jgi:hypothetical protein
MKNYLMQHHYSKILAIIIVLMLLSGIVIPFFSIKTMDPQRRQRDLIDRREINDQEKSLDLQNRGAIKQNYREIQQMQQPKNDPNFEEDSSDVRLNKILVLHNKRFVDKIIRWGKKNLNDQGKRMLDQMMYDPRNFEIRYIDLPFYTLRSSKITYNMSLYEIYLNKIAQHIEEKVPIDFVKNEIFPQTGITYKQLEEFGVKHILGQIINIMLYNH